MFQRRRSGKAPRRAPRERIISGAAAVEALAYPLRQELIDTLQACGGEATVGELAEQLGRSADGLYYHLRLLVKRKLIIEDRQRNAAGRQERRYRIALPGDGQLRLAYRPEKKRDATALRKVVAGMLRIARRDFDEALAREEPVVVEGPRRQLWAGRTKGWVSEAELIEINQLIGRLHALLDRPRDDQRRHLTSLCFVLAPVEPQPKRRGDDGDGDDGDGDDGDDDDDDE